MSTLRKSAQYYCRAFISINGGRMGNAFLKTKEKTKHKTKEK